MTFTLNLDTPQEKTEHIAESSSRHDVKYNFYDIPGSFLNDEQAFNGIIKTISTLEDSINKKTDINTAYAAFVDLIKSEMKAKLKQNTPNTGNVKRPHKSKLKPYWTAELQHIWDELCQYERQWLRCNDVNKKNKYFSKADELIKKQKK